MSITRVHYRERQRLLAVDLLAEQDYRLALAGRHHLASHRWGIVHGLALIETASGEWVIEPGVAVDGDGREILVPAATPVPGGAPSQCSFVLLYYCDEPERPCGDADESVPARIRQGFRLVVSKDFEPGSGEPTELVAARAAGKKTGSSPRPVVIARLGPGCASGKGKAIEVDYSWTRYVSHQSSRLMGVNGRASLRLGLATYSDSCHFLLSTAGPALALSPRLGIDRLGVVQFWRKLAITGPFAVGNVELANQASLRIEAMMPAGIGRRLLLQAQLDPETSSLTASLFDLGSSQPLAVSDRVTVAADKPLATTLNFAGLGSASIALFDALDQKRSPFAEPATALPRPRAARKNVAAKRASQPPPGAPVFQSVRVQLGASGGVLALHALDGATTPVLQLAPGATVATDPMARELYVLQMVTPDLVPQTELRISAGAEEESERSSRISIGGRIEGTWRNALTMDGGRRLALQGLMANRRHLGWR